MSANPSPVAARFLSVADLDPRGIVELIERAIALKARHGPSTSPARSADRPLVGRAVALVFQKPSLRTRVSFEVGVAKLGGTPVVLVGDEVGLGSREAPRDVARTLERFADAIVARVFDHALLTELADAAVVPVINALSDAEHPCQALADMMVLAERWGGVEGLAGRQLVYVGDGNNVAASLLLAAASLGLHLRWVGPAGYEPDPLIVGHARHLAEETGARIELGHDPVAGITGADAVYTDVWASMGQEEQVERRREVFRRYAITRQLLDAAPGALVMHCLPAHRGDEITSEVLDGPTSIVFDQAEDRMWVQMALLLTLMGAGTGS
jgi:ornithine carbamoyltransferase